MPRVVAAPFPYLRLRRWRRRLLGPAVLSWFREGRARAVRSVGRDGQGAGRSRPRSGAGRGGRGRGVGGREGAGAPAPPLGCRENGDTAFGLAFCLWTNPLSTCPGRKQDPCWRCEETEARSPPGQLLALGAGRSRWAGLESESSVGKGSGPYSTRTSGGLFQLPRGPTSPAKPSAAEKSCSQKQGRCKQQLDPLKGLNKCEG